MTAERRIERKLDAEEAEQVDVASEEQEETLDERLLGQGTRCF